MHAFTHPIMPGLPLWLTWTPLLTLQPNGDASKSEIRVCEILQKHCSAEGDISLQDDMLAEIEVGAPRKR
jgi:hypothetical protein